MYKDPAGLSPLCDETEFAADLQLMVSEEAPRLFAVIQEYGDRVDARIAAWGMAFPDHADLTTRGSWMSTESPERALHRFNRAPHVRARLIWVTPEDDVTLMA
jgi:hypothetical protein